MERFEGMFALAQCNVRIDEDADDLALEAAKIRGTTKAAFVEEAIKHYCKACGVAEEIRARHARKMNLLQVV